MYARGLITTAIVYEVAKDRLHHDNLFPSIEEALEKLPEPDRTVEPCTGNILCERQGARHKAGCLGKTEPIDTFWRKVNNA